MEQDIHDYEDQIAQAEWEQNQSEIGKAEAQIAYEEAMLPKTWQDNMFQQKKLYLWQLNNFGNETAMHMLAGMTEELGELAHALLKKEQKIRQGLDATICNVLIADAFGDILVYGNQLLTILGIDAEEAYNNTLKEILQRDWKKFPKNGLTE
jgi:NTP pyrophosphatase (non-canonical NTP hydrolase)